MGISHYADKETRKRLSLKSFLIYGTKNGYRKFMLNNGLTIEGVEDIMDLMLKKMEKSNGPENTEETVRRTKSEKTK